MMGMMWLWWIFWIVVLALAAWGVYRFTRRRAAGPGEQAPSTQATPMDTLQQRYASGDISTDEYEERRRKLKEE